MEEGRALRSKSRGRGNQDKNAEAMATERATNTNTIPSLMSLAFPEIPATTQPATTQPAAVQQTASQQNTPSSEADNTIVSPQYTSAAAQEIRHQFQSLRLSQRIGDGNETVINSDGLTLRDYVSASVGASQAAVMNQVKESLQQMVPRIVREVMRAERNYSFDTFNQTANQQYTAYENSQRRQYDLPNQQYQQQSPVPTTISHQLPKQHLPSDLEKWGIKFDGSRKSFTVEDFVFRVESLQVDYNCSMTTLMKGFHHLLIGNAYEWFWTFRRENPYCEWDQLKFNLIRKFRRFESDTKIQRCIMERRQHPAETSEAFIGEVIMLKNQLSRSIREEELVRIVKDNLKDGIYQLIYPINIRSFDHLLDECRRAERNIAKRNSHRQFQTRRVNEVSYNEVDEENKFQIEALKATPPAKQLICWNCKSPGHSFVECSSEQRNLFCYKCGFENVITPKCPRCTENQYMNMVKAGTLCSNPDQRRQIP